MGEITLAGFTFDEESAKKAIAGYCFGTEEVAWEAQWSSTTKAILDRAPSLQPTIASSERYRFAYAAYDCARPRSADPDPRLSILASNALNARINQKVIAALEVTVPRAFEILADVSKPFWKMDAEPLRDPSRSRDSDSDEAKLWQAWTLLMRTKGADLAVTHKVLHHGFPRTFPLLDGLTRTPIKRASEGRDLWTQIHFELETHSSFFQTLEDWFKDELSQVDWRGIDPEPVPLSRMRLHDILVWLKASGSWATAVGAS